MRNVFQLAYVTNDLDRAGRVLCEQFGCGEVHFMRDLPESLADIALSFSGDTNYELLQPRHASGDFYSNWIAGAQDFVMRFHHLGMIVPTREEYSSIREAHLAQGRGFPLEASMPGQLDVFYADATDTLGHYLEYFHLEEGGWAMFKAVPGCPF